MAKRQSGSENRLVLVIDRPLFEALEIDADTELEGKKFSLRFQLCIFSTSDNTRYDKRWE